VLICVHAVCLSTSCRRFNAGVGRVAVFMSNRSGRVGYGLKLLFLSDIGSGVLLITAGTGQVRVYQTGPVQDSVIDE